MPNLTHSRWVPLTEHAQTMGMVERVEASLPSLPPAEQRVGRMLLGDPKSFASLPVNELAQRARVSSPTVVRFCRSVGFEGLSDFKRKLDAHTNEGIPFIHPAIAIGDKTPDLVLKVIDNALAAFLGHRRKLNASAVEQASKAIAHTRNVGQRLVFFGVAVSGIVAQDAQQKFTRLGIHAEACLDSHFQAMTASLLRCGDCLVIISNSGRNRDMLDLADIASKNGATLVVITPTGTPLSLMGNCLLATDHTEHFECFEPMASRLIQLLTIDVLFTCVAMHIGVDQLQPLLRTARHSLRNKRYG